MRITVLAITATCYTIATRLPINYAYEVLCVLYPLHTCIRLPSRCWLSQMQQCDKFSDEDYPRSYNSTQWESTNQFQEPQSNRFYEKPEGASKSYNSIEKQCESADSLPNNQPENNRQANDRYNQPKEAKITEFPRVRF